MENTTNKQATVIPTATLPFRATVSMGEFYDEDAKESRQYVSCTLENPFQDEDFVNIRISPKWKSLKGTFEFKAKKVLRTQESFEIEGVIKVGSYYSKRKKRKVTYPAMFVNNPFGDGTIEFGIKREEDAAVFAMLASDHFKTQCDTETSDTESPLR